MRINVYEEELTDDIRVVETVAGNGSVWYGVRMHLKSHPALHDSPMDNDQSAVTLWVGRKPIAERLRSAIVDVLTQPNHTVFKDTNYDETIPMAATPMERRY